MKKKLLYIFTLIIPFGHITFGQTVHFEAPESIAIGKSVSEINAHDFDKDGHMDFFAGAGSPGSGTIGFGDGTGLFTTLTVSLQGPENEINDFNNDGFKDIASLSSNAVFIYLNNGNRGFLSPSNLTIAASPSKIISGDFNNDGKSDIVIGYPTSVSFYWGKGDATFEGPVTTIIPNPITDWTTGDINKDGYTDIIYCNSDGNVICILRGNGSGTFSDTQHSAGSVNYPNVVRVADFNNDSFLDIATGNTGLAATSVSIFLNSAGNFSTFTSYAAGGHVAGITTGDFNKDGKTDLATSNSNSGSVSILLNAGDGIFAAQTKYMAGNRPNDIVCVDFNEDSYIDFLVGNFTSQDVSLIKGKGDGSIYSAKS